MSNPSYIPFGQRVINAGGVLTNKYKMNGIHVINKTGSAIAIDKVVAVVGFDTTTELPKIVLADANEPTHRDIYVTLAAIANGAEGQVFKGGLSSAVLNTNSATTVGDPVYLSETAGGFVHTAPSGAVVIPIGWVATKSATIGEIHWHIGEVEATGGSGVAATVAATNTLTSADNGKTIFLNSATEFATTLPAPALGLNFTFIVAAAPSGASYTIVTAGATETLVGGQHDAGGAAGDVESTLGGTTITFVDGQAKIGDTAMLWSDGTNWYTRIFTNVAAGATITG